MVRKCFLIAKIHYLTIGLSRPSPIYRTVKVTVKWAIKIENAPNRLGTTWNMCRNHPANFLTVKTWF